MSDIIKIREENSNQKPIYLFGKDVREIKCFRSSFICGICSGVAGGLGCFLFTSRVILSTNAAFAFLWIGVFSYWIPCRYKYETSLYMMEAAKAGNLRLKNPPNSDSEEKIS